MHCTVLLTNKFILFVVQLYYQLYYLKIKTSSRTIIELHYFTLLHHKNKDLI